jgi:hypothetical protein
MTCELIPSELTDEQKGQIYGILSVGCDRDRQTAANFVGCSLAQIRRAMQQDATFAAGVCRAQAGAELNHMRNIQQAAKDVKNWRAAVWWLERRSPERFGPRGPGVVTARQLKAFLEILGDALREEVRDARDRRQVVARLSHLADSVDRMLRDTQMDVGTAASDASGPIADTAHGLTEDTLADDWCGSNDDIPP